MLYPAGLLRETAASWDLSEQGRRKLEAGGSCTKVKNERATKLCDRISAPAKFFSQGSFGVLHFNSNSMITNVLVGQLHI